MPHFKELTSTHWEKRHQASNLKQPLNSGEDDRIEKFKHTSSYKDTRITTIEKLSKKKKKKTLEHTEKTFIIQEQGRAMSGW